MDFTTCPYVGAFSGAAVSTALLPLNILFRDARSGLADILTLGLLLVLSRPLY